MDRKKQRCPYCGKRMSYSWAYVSRKKAEYVCTRCGRESGVVIDKIIIPIFIIVAVICIGIIGAWFWLDMFSFHNFDIAGYKWGIIIYVPLGVLVVIVPLIIFHFFTPKFVRLEPLKKYEKSMEAKKAGIEFSDNLAALEIDNEINSSLENSGQFHINSDVFNQIKSERNTPREVEESDDIVSDSKQTGEMSYVSVIDDVREDHAKTTSYPLKKLHSEGAKVSRPRHYLPAQEEEVIEESEAYAEDDADVKEYKKPDTNKYSANRRF